jgi:hypothetical protein
MDEATDAGGNGLTMHWVTNMKGTFSTKVTNAIKTMQPIPAVAIPWPTVQDGLIKLS